MDRLISKVRIEVNSQIYLKDPESSELGIKIISGGIDMINEMGFEDFTFGKLAKAIKSTEASIYRYFESKHKFLLYITNWYWSWMEYRLVFGLANIPSAEERLKRAIGLLTEQVEEDSSFGHINEIKLNRIINTESSKAYLTRQVDEENRHGIFLPYKDLVARVSDIILEINPRYKYPHMLVSTVVESAHHQRYFAEHLPRLTDQLKGEDSITQFSIELVMNTIKQ